MSHEPDDQEANLLARLASPDPAERWRASGDVHRRFFDDVRRITLKLQGRRLPAEEAADIAQEAFKKFGMQLVRRPFIAQKIWGVREYVLVTARRLVIKRLKHPDPGCAQRKEFDLARLEGDPAEDVGGELPTEWTTSDSVVAGHRTDADDELPEEQGAGEQQDPDAAVPPEARIEWATSPAPSESGSATEVPPGVLDGLVIAAFEALRLSEKDRDILRLAATKSGSYEEIGNVFGTSAGYIRKRYCVLKKRLEACILSLLSRYDAATASVIRRRLDLSVYKEPSA